MKKHLLSFAIICSSFFALAQTAPNFTANDCASNSHDLYTELNSGKIVVITWVMPCGSCINGAKAAQAAVQSFSASNPGMVLHYVADDYANSTCTTLQNWLATNSITPNAVFTNTAVNMSGYGSAGMPKVVVLGNTSHTVYYNVNNSAITQSNITSAINTAISAQATSIQQVSKSAFNTGVHPNPVINELNVSMSVNATENINIDIYNLVGQKVISLEKTVSPGVNAFTINTEDLSSGQYYLTLKSAQAVETIKFIVNK